MPIHCPLTIRDLSPSEFDATDKVVMAHAYACQNALGRLCDEKVYENDLALRLRAAGHEVHTQVPIHLTQHGFKKTCHLDLVCDHAVYDAKAVSLLIGAHDAQVLSYAMMLDVRHIKLLNFRNAKVEGRLRFNPLTGEKRRQVQFDTRHWQPLTGQCETLRQRMTEIVHDWGAFLDARPYEEALVWFCGGEPACLRRVELRRDGHSIGWHNAQQHGDGCCFVVSSTTKELPAYQSHLERLLRLTNLLGLQWINLCHDQIQFTTLSVKRMGSSE